MAHYDTVGLARLASKFLKSLVKHLRATDRRRLVEVPYHINDPRFAAIAADEFLAIVG